MDRRILPDFEMDLFKLSRVVDGREELAELEMFIWGPVLHP